jgi:hypothetical protein
MTDRPGHSRNNSNSHRPSQPSALRHSHTLDGPSESTPLIHTDECTQGVCTHGTFSPRPSSPAGLDNGFFSEASSETAGPAGGDTRNDDDWKQWLQRRMRTKKMGKSRHLAAQAGLKDTPLM